jgi:hypothetical protein
MAQSTYGRSSDLKDQATDQFGKAADQAEKIANRATEQGREVGERIEVVSDATAQAMVQAPLALLGTLFSAPRGAASAFKTARVLDRNFPWCSCW